MDTNELTPFVYLLVLIGILLGVGVLVFGELGSASRDETVVTNESVTLSASAFVTVNSPLLAVASIENATAKFVYPTHLNFSSDGKVNVTALNGSTGTYLLTYTYDAPSPTTHVMSNSTGAIAPIADTWMGLIVTIAALAIILGLVIRAFAGRDR